MKILNATRPSMLLKDLYPGDCFWDDDNDAICMKTSRMDEEFNESLCVYIEDGDTCFFSRDRAVRVMNVTAVIGDEEETQD